jgi:hypothetical protein
VIVWPVSWLVRGRARPGGLTLAGEAGLPCGPPLQARPGPPDVTGEGPAPGRWAKNRTKRHLAPAPVGGHPQKTVPACGLHAVRARSVSRSFHPDRAGALRGPAAIPCCLRCHSERQMPRVPGSARYVMIVARGAGALLGRAGTVRGLSSLPP